MVSAIIAAGGKGTRMGAGINKVYLPLCGKEILARTLSVFEACSCVDEVIVVTGESELERLQELSKKYKFQKISAAVSGGATRGKSVFHGLCRASGDFILIHDAARALITEDEIFRVLTDCKQYGAAALGVKCKDTLKRADQNGFIAETLDRENTYQIQTPQAFSRDIIQRAYDASQDFAATDDCALVEKLGIPIKITEGSYENIKLTTPSDLAVGEEILKRRNAL